MTAVRAGHRQAPDNSGRSRVAKKLLLSSAAGKLQRNGDVITTWHVLRDLHRCLRWPPASRPLQLPA